MVVKKSEYSPTTLINELRINLKDFINKLRMNEDTYLRLTIIIDIII